MIANAFRFTCDDYYRLADVGILGPDERVELLDGVIVTMSPIGPLHASIVEHLRDWARDELRDVAQIRAQNPVRLSDHSEPEPDIALVRARDDEYRSAHPTPADVLLIIEVADSSAENDLTDKPRLYAAAGIPEYWVLNLQERTAIVHRNPRDAAYSDVRTLTREEAMTPQAFPQLTLDLQRVFRDAQG